MANRHECRRGGKRCQREWCDGCRDRGAGGAGNEYGVVPRVSTKECRGWVGERAWQSAEGREGERVPRMRSSEQQRWGVMRRMKRRMVRVPQEP
jgi:hypothetical protein